MKEKVIYIWILIFISCRITISLAQTDSLKTIPSDTIRQDPWLNPKKISIQAGFDSRNSFFAGRGVRLFGIRAGIQHYYKFRTGLGIYGFREPVYMRDVRIDKPDASAEQISQFNLSFLALYFDKIIYKTRRWELSAPIYLGAGTLNAYYKDTSNIFVPWHELPFTSLEFTAEGSYRPIRWFSIGVGVGYRWIFRGEAELKRAFNSPIYAFRFSILFGELYRMIFKEKIWKRKDNELNNSEMERKI